MANKQKGVVEITLDKKRKLKFDLNAFAEIEDTLGVPMSRMSEIEMGMKTVRTLLYAGLLHEDEEMTERKAGSLVTMENMEEVQKAIGEAFAAAAPAKN
ncbi:hypothetical protein [Bacillus wiedmannii]|uniref:hypothetical protein n=1 Tax=Bacillus wiedmannii TaxID=1890302 RepID=UPI000BEF57E4|nr:hypothetical protein [Bacillus wiedmannii]PEM08507.1 hypothetical protein CN610_19840 [Bacillus wiedmannii]